MKERPILFSGPMVRALLAGTKTQTRRLMKPQPDPLPADRPRISPYDDSGFHWASDKCRSMVDLATAAQLGPYGWKGDRLWVREAASRLGLTDFSTFDADGADTKATHWPWQRERIPSIHLPRRLSRITLELTSVRIERLQSISEQDAKAEGVEPLKHVGADQPFADGSDRTQGNSPYALAFAVLWDTINGEKALWSSNPWVWVVGFRRLP